MYQISPKLVDTLYGQKVGHSMCHKFYESTKAKTVNSVSYLKHRNRHNSETKNKLLAHRKNKLDSFLEGRRIINSNILEKFKVE